MDRKTPLISKNKLVTAIKLYEKYIDDTVEKITIWSSTRYQIEGGKHSYIVDISNNKVSIAYPDPDYN